MELGIADLGCHRDSESSRGASLWFSTWITPCSVIDEWKRTIWFFVILIPNSLSRASSTFSWRINVSAAMLVGLKTLTLLLIGISSKVTVTSTFVFSVPYNPLINPELLDACARYFGAFIWDMDSSVRHSSSLASRSISSKRSPSVFVHRSYPRIIHCHRVLEMWLWSSACTH